MVVAIVILSHNAFAKSAKRPAHRAKPSVTVIDLSAPPAPDSAWPAVAKKGHL